MPEVEPERCVCGHGPEHHPASPWRQNTFSGRSYWIRRCHGNKGYDMLTGEKPCRCKGYVRQ